MRASGGTPSLLDTTALFAGEWLFARSGGRSKLLKHALAGILPYLALLTLYALLRTGLPGEGLALGGVTGLSARLPAVFAAITDYARLLVFPFNLHLERYVTTATWDIEAWTKTDEGAQLHDQETLYFGKLDQFPSRADLTRTTLELIASLKELKTASPMDPYVGPAIFSPDATAVLFHEAIGHRLEGDRLRRDKDGKTFLKKIGQRILPEFVTVVDNPTLESYHGTPLIGHYHTDDQGQQSREVVLIDRGVLKSFLLSRTPVLGFNQTNGHARSDGIHVPMSRMSNFIVKSDLTLDAASLKQRLIAEVRKQNKPYGLFVKKIIEGETQTDSRQFQVFKGKPLYLYKVFPDGREELVRGVDFVGTPLSMISKILITGDDPTVINGFCTAESGVLPVASITPSVLLSEVELQASHQPQVRRPILTPPKVVSSH